MAFVDGTGRVSRPRSGTAAMCTYANLDIS
jgi:hypothetical protein